jgi:lipopolysaccharide export system protein LptA
MTSPPVLTIIKIFRRLWLGIVIMIVVVVGINLIISISREKERREWPKVDDSLFLEKKEKIQFQEVRKGAKEHLRVKAEQHYLGEDELFHLEGGVEIVFPQKQAGEDVVIRTDSLVYDREFSHFWTTGPTEVKWGEVEIKAGQIDYYATQEEFEGRGEVKIKTDKWAIEATSFKVGVRSKKIECQGEVNLQLIDFWATEKPLIVLTQRFLYDRRSKIGACQDEVILQHGATQGKADEMEFKLGAGESFIKWLRLRGSVKLQLKNEWASNSAIAGSNLSSWFYLAGQEIEAETIFVESFARTRSIKIIELTNNSKIKFMSTNNEFSELRGETIKVLFTTRGELKEFVAREKASLFKQGEEEKNQITLSGERLEIRGKNQVLIVVGAQNERAFFDNRRLRFTAGRIEIKLDNNELKGLEGIEATLKEEGEAKSPGEGFFDPQKLFFLTSEEMRSRREGKRLVFMGKVKIWQETRILKAEKVVLETDTSRLEAQEKVEVSIITTRPEAGQEKLWIKGKEMTFDPVNKTMEFKNDISLEMGKIKIESQQFRLFFDQKTNELSKFEAIDKVSVSFKEIKALAQRANYLYDQQVLILTGQPLLEDPSRGKIRGDKLTFHLPDDRIIVENKGEERSIILIKS